MRLSITVGYICRFGPSGRLYGSRCGFLLISVCCCRCSSVAHVSSSWSWWAMIGVSGCSCFCVFRSVLRFLDEGALFTPSGLF